MITSQDGRLTIDLPDDLTPSHPSRSSTAASPVILTDEQMRNLERDNTLAALQLCHGKLFGKDGAAQLLGIKPTTLASRLKRLEINL